MPSDYKKAKAAAKKTGGRRKKQPAKTEAVPELNGNETEIVTNGDTIAITNGVAKINVTPGKYDEDEEYLGSDSENETGNKNDIETFDLLSESACDNRTVTSVLTSQPQSRDLQFTSVSMTFHGQEILVDSDLELNNGRRYGLIGLNGCGKSSLLAVLQTEQIPIPSHIDHFLLQREMEPSNKTALQCVMEVDEERVRLEAEAEVLAVNCDDDESHERLMEVYERLDAMDADIAEKRAGELLNGLGFTKEMQNKEVKHFSGGWRMRIALARALFLKPALLMLDEPTNHLDLNACVWLEKELSQYNRILIIISHSEDFLNGVCTNIIHFHDQKLKTYGGNYDTYIQTRSELEENQKKRYKREQDEVSNMKNYIAKFGHGSKKLARQAQSKEKTLKKMIDAGLTKRVTTDKTVAFCFPDPGNIPPPVIQIQNVSFRYNEKKPYIYKNLDFGVDLDTRVALVGPNGAGKSTLLKLIARELEPTDGLIRRHSHVKIGRYHQHLHEILDINMTALDWMMGQFPAVKERDDMRKRLGRYGLSGAQQVCPIRVLSDGQRCRIIFAWLAESCPHLLLLDEPTNHLDLETIDALAEALQEFQGGMLLVSHDFRLISRVAEEIWLCNDETVTKWQGDIQSYKQHLKDSIENA